MRKNLRGLQWLVGCAVSVSLLGACAPEDESAGREPGADVQEVGQDLSADLRGVTVTLSAEKASFSATEDARVTVTLHNGGRHAVKLLKWEAGTEGLEDDLFEVKRDGVDVAYEGPHYKRGELREEYYVRLAPGESLTSTVDLAGFYDLSKTGSYSFQYALESHGSNRNRTKLGGTNELKLWIEGRQPAQPVEDGPVTVNGLSYSKCDATQQSTLVSAISASSSMANNSVTYLNGTPAATARYTTWFGAYSLNGWNTAKSHFAAIKDAIDTKPITIDCGCKKTYYAYVYPNQPYKIYVCKAFWAAPMSGTDSKGGTLIHELSHFTVVAGTDDWAYGQTNAKSLAISDPTKALNNADSHEYFAENTPSLQ
jgi:peptidyl-Lys metalloendopeptidase